MVEIEKDIPVPEGAGRMGKPAKYPFKAMEVGDSFFVTAEDSKRVMMALSQQGRRYGMKFVSRKWEDGRRVWRIA